MENKNLCFQLPVKQSLNFLVKFSDWIRPRCCEPVKTAELCKLQLIPLKLWPELKAQKTNLMTSLVPNSPIHHKLAEQNIREQNHDLR